MSNVIPLIRCKCGAAGKRFELCFREESLGEFSSCEACLAETTDLLDRVRPVFDAMIAAGIDREKANLTMEHLLGLIDPLPS